MPITRRPLVMVGSSVSELPVGDQLPTDTIPTDDLQIILRKGTDAERQAVIFAEGEEVLSTDTKETWIGDGETPGGVPDGGGTPYYLYPNGRISPNASEIIWTKLSTPEIIPSSYGTGVAWSPNGVYLAIACQASTLIMVYKYVGGVFTKLPNITPQPSSHAVDVVWSPDGHYLAVAHQGTPYVSVYHLQEDDSLVKITNPSALPTGNSKSVSWSPNGTYLAVGHATTPFLTVYSFQNETLTKLADPATLPTGTGNGVSWSHNGMYLAVSHVSSPFLTVYSFQNETLTKLADPATLPTTNSYCSAWTADDSYLLLAVGSSTTGPNFIIYRLIDGVFTKIPTTNIEGGVTGFFSSNKVIALSPNGQYLAVGFVVLPYVTIFRWDNANGTLAKQSVPDPLYVGSDGYAVAWSPDGTKLAVATKLSPYIIIYEITNTPVGKVLLRSIPL